MGLSFVSNCTKLISGSLDGQIKIWNVQTSKEIRTIDSGIHLLALDVCDSFIFSAGSDESIKMWDINSGKLIR